MMLNTKYQGSRPCGFRQEDFVTFSYISLCKTCDPQGQAFLAPGPGQFWPKGYNLNKLDRGPLGVMLNTKYQQSRLSSFRQEDF